MVVPRGEWLSHLLPLCDLGCCLDACVNSQERMFITASLEQNEVYGLYGLPWTFEEWLWRWIRDEDIIMG